MQYDLVILTHLPCFYKVNLYNQLAKKMKLHVIFLGRQSNIRSEDFVRYDFQFTATFLSKGAFETRNRWASLLKLRSTLNQLNYKKLIVGGWEHLEFWLGVLISPKSKNFLCLESGVESATTGARGWLKKKFLSRLSGILASGIPQSNLAKHLSFSQPIYVTRGVGLFAHPKSEKVVKPFKRRFLYVGRLASEKNIGLLLQAFEKRPQFKLTVVGQGPIVVEPTANVAVLGHVPHNQLPLVYQINDVFILPSLQEPWGLVVEEALYHGLPIIISDRVGAKELVETYQVGKIFSPTSLDSLLQAMDEIVQPKAYQACLENLAQPIIEQSQAHQVQAYEQVGK